MVQVKIVPDVRRSKSNDRFPLKLRITYKGTRKYYASGYHATDHDWEMINSLDAKGKLRRIRNAIVEIEWKLRSKYTSITVQSIPVKEGHKSVDKIS